MNTIEVNVGTLGDEVMRDQSSRTPPSGRTSVKHMVICHDHHMLTLQRQAQARKLYTEKIRGFSWKEVDISLSSNFFQENLRQNEKEGVLTIHIYARINSGTVVSDDLLRSSIWLSFANQLSATLQASRGSLLDSTKSKALVEKVIQEIVPGSQICVDVPQVRPFSF
jgi:hypothetical protein